MSAEQMFEVASRISRGERIDSLELLTAIRAADRMGWNKWADHLADILERQLHELEGTR